MTPRGFGIRVIALAWIVLSAVITGVMAILALAMDSFDPYGAALWGLYAATLLALPTLGASVVVGLSAWVWAQTRRSPSEPEVQG